jgi:hypothetical protein
MAWQQNSCIYGHSITLSGTCGDRVIPSLSQCTKSDYTNDSVRGNIYRVQY